jgi:AraC-like DNA-binding protein
MTARTLQRHLGEEGSSYKILLDEVRLEIARTALSQSDEAIADIAQRLGYAEPRSFHRSFKQWTGLTPGDYRTSYRTGLKPPTL